MPMDESTADVLRFSTALVTAAVHGDMQTMLDLIETTRDRPTVALVGLANWAAVLAKVHGERTGLTTEQVMEGVGIVIARQSEGMG